MNSKLRKNFLKNMAWVGFNHVPLESQPACSTRVWPIQGLTQMSDVPMLAWMNRPISMFILPVCWTDTVGERGVYTMIAKGSYIMLWVPGRSCVQLQHADRWRRGWGSGWAAVKFSHTYWETAVFCLPHLQVTLDTGRYWHPVYITVSKEYLRRIQIILCC